MTWLFALGVIVGTATPLIVGSSLLLAYPNRPLNWVSYAMWGVAVALAVYASSQVTRWDFCGPVALWATWVSLICVFVARGYLERAEVQWVLPHWKFVLVAIACVGTASALLLVARARPGDDVAVAMQMPIQAARWHVAHGGSTRAVNHHVVVPAQKYALDLVVVGPEGRRATGLFPEKLTAYVAFGTSIVAPCEGVVAARENSKPDMPVGQMDPDNPAGNFVALQCGEVVVVLAHLQQGSVPLQVGTVVRAGQQIGRIGNSGNTSEPHLHIHAVRGRFTSLDALLFEGSGVPLTFDGRFLLRGDSGH